MKYSMTGIVTLAILLLSQACTSVKSKEATHDGHIVSQHSENIHHDYNADNHQSQSSTTQAKLTAPKNLAANQSVALVIDIQDNQGKSVTKFDKFQEQLMHLIIVSDDLEYFNHLHPNYKGNGRFEVKTNFPDAKNYTLFSDFKPTGGNERVTLMNINVPGSTPIPKELAKYSNTKILSDTKVNLSFSQPNLKADQEVNLKFDLKAVNNNQPIKNLQPYLGEKGHLVIIKSSSPLTTSDYIHAHALKDSPDGQVNFVTTFPQPGTYKLWMQFQRNNKINTADFWVNVQ